MAASDPATFADMLAMEQAAEAAVIVGDPEPYKALWSRGEDVSLFGAFGPCKKGWPQLEKTFNWVASRYREGVVTNEYEVVYEGADLAYTVGYEIDDVVLDGAPTRLRLRVTQIYRREDGQWHLVHRHGDFAPADQSPLWPE
jgi:ketosteroid isomerase-like protein